MIRVILVQGGPKALLAHQDLLELVERVEALCKAPLAQQDLWGLQEQGVFKAKEVRKAKEVSDHRDLWGLQEQGVFKVNVALKVHLDQAPLFQDVIVQIVQRPGTTREVEI